MSRNLPLSNSATPSTGLLYLKVSKYDANSTIFTLIRQNFKTRKKVATLSPVWITHRNPSFLYNNLRIRCEKMGDFQNSSF